MGVMFECSDGTGVMFGHLNGMGVIFGPLDGMGVKNIGNVNPSTWRNLLGGPPSTLNQLDGLELGKLLGGPLLDCGGDNL